MGSSLYGGGGGGGEAVFPEVGEGKCGHILGIFGISVFF